MKKSGSGEEKKRQAEEATTHLVSQLIHDVRNLFNSLVLEITDLREEAESQGARFDVRRLTDQVRESTERLQLIRDRLDVVNLRTTEVDLREWLNGVRSQVISSEAYEDLVIWPELPEALHGGKSIDRQLLAAAIGELLDNAANAVELDDAEGTVEVKIQQEGGEVSVEITNPCSAERVPPFLSQLGQSRGLVSIKRNLGLGCFFARRVVELHGGSLVWRHDTDKALFSTTIRF